MNEKELVNKALQYFDSGYNCAESMLLVFLEAFDKDKSIVKLTTPLGRGIGGKKDICGVLTAGVLAIGLKYGRTSPDQEKDEAYKKASEYYNCFSSKFKTKCCEIRTKDKGREVCREVLVKSVEYLYKMLVK